MVTTTTSSPEVAEFGRHRRAPLHISKNTKDDGLVMVRLPQKKIEEYAKGARVLVAIHTSDLDFRAIQRIATIQITSGFTRGIQPYVNSNDDLLLTAGIASGL
jgi:hypothetical protein